ncbi:MAG: hypothetical protein Q7S28_00235 [bacterium]|nr:hypothetical protein [bacterium]
MADQQLLTYVKAQIDGGAKAEDVKKALLASGWGAQDVDDALKASAPAPAVQAAVVSPQSVQPKEKSEPKDAGAAASPKAQSTGPGSGTGSVDSIVSHEVTFPKEMAKVAKESGIVPGLSGKKFSRVSLILGILLVLSLLGNGYLVYKSSTSESDLNKQISELTRIKNDETGQANALRLQVADLTKKNSDLTADNERMQSMSLSFGQLFGLKLSTTSLGSSTIVSFGTGTSTVQVKGSLGQAFYGKTLRYVVYDVSTGLYMTILNSSEAKVDNAFKPYVGSEVTIGGEHVVGSREVTAVTLNGDPL